MILDAASITRYQACRRQFALSVDWRVRRQRPKSLFDRVLRKGIVELSSGADPAVVAVNAKSAYLEAAADPGLDVAANANPYVIAKDYCAMLDTILRALAKVALLVVHRPPLVPLADNLDWRALSDADDSGAIHRWITVDSWTLTDLEREGHSWYVMGDMAVLGAPMTIHVVVIGRQVGGRRASAWARGFKNPGLPNVKMHFVGKGGKPLKGWTPTYLADDSTFSPDDWVAQMIAEGAAQALVKHVPVALPTADVIADTKRQIVAENAAMRAILLRGDHWSALPMSRAACDGFVRCPFQEVCYGAGAADGTLEVGAVGLYERRNQVVRSTLFPNRLLTAV